MKTEGQEEEEERGHMSSCHPQLALLPSCDELIPAGNVRCIGDQFCTSDYLQTWDKKCIPAASQTPWLPSPRPPHFLLILRLSSSQPSTSLHAHRALLSRLPLKVNLEQFVMFITLKTPNFEEAAPQVYLI